MGLDAAVAVRVGVSVGGIYGVAVGAVATAPPAGVAVSAAGSAGPLQASTVDAAAMRATIAPAMATVIGFLLEAILGCLSCGFMTRKCYTTPVHGDGGWHCATVVAMRAGGAVGFELGSSLDRGDFESHLDKPWS